MTDFTVLDTARILAEILDQNRDGKKVVNNFWINCNYILSLMMPMSFFSQILYNHLILGVVDDPKVHAQLNCTAWITVHTSDISFQLTGRQAYFEVRSDMLWESFRRIIRSCM